jgi:ABC-type glycerol-3-phosphate transport system substrate-binding protein
MTKSTPDPDAAWKLMKYLAATDETGTIYVPKHLIALDLGLGTPYPDVNGDAQVKASWKKWSDVDLLIEQIGKSKQVGPVVNQTWFPKFQEVIAGLLQEAVLGRRTIPDALKKAADEANANR